MIYVFEDFSEHKISKLYQYFIKENMPQCISCIRYTMGNGNIKYKIPEWYKEGETYICFIDVIPDNKETIKEFNKTARKLSTYNNVYLVPTLPSECQLITSLPDGIIDEKIQSVCKDKLLYTEEVAELLRTKYDCKSMEKVFKKFLDNSKSCLRAELHFTKDCETATLSDKSISFIKSYPIFPRLTFSESSIKNMNEWYYNYMKHYSEWIYTMSGLKLYRGNKV